MQWKDIPNHNGTYAISEFGQIRRNKDGLILKAHTNRKGYLRVNLNQNGKQRLHLVSSLVAETFIGKRPLGFTVNHKDFNKINNHHFNLEYLSNLNNMRHAWDNGIHDLKKGSTNHTAKLTEENVKFIRSATPFNKYELAKMFKVNESTIRNVRNRKTWKHI